MTQTAAEMNGGDRMPLCLSIIDGLHSVIARMPTQQERQYHKLPSDVPVVVLRFRGGREQVVSAGLVMLTIDSGPAPSESATATAAKYVASHILENLGNLSADLTALGDAMGSPGKIVRLAAEIAEEREREFTTCHGPSPSTGCPHWPGDAAQRG